MGTGSDAKSVLTGSTIESGGFCYELEPSRSDESKVLIPSAAERKIVGHSQGMREVWSQVASVATSDATVLILGETGTGKELVAQAIHEMSARSGAPFVKVNCAAIPTGLLESELFGHEKGAFTGAICQKVGRFEVAEGGTVFLDEIGDVPPELQPKLLRVLQEHEFERLGSNHTQRVNVRVVAATHRDLHKSVAQGQFRSDLYYRLSVFPIRVPALRERPEDLPLLVCHFIRKFAKRMNKRVMGISSKNMEALVKWYWPGNVRELENLLERSMILSNGTELIVPLSDFANLPAQPSEALEDVERDHIVRIMQSARWVISGPNGAAARLKIKRTTLQSKLRKLGIRREDFRATRSAE